MKQENFLESSSGKEKHTLWKIFIDGASRNNPGRSGAGVVIYKNDVKISSSGYYLGIKTNNQAEYGALLLALFLFKDLYQPGDYLQIISDSLLLVQQMKGLYQVRNPELYKLRAAARQMVGTIPTDFVHVLREENVEADLMANSGIDTKQSLPPQFVSYLATHDIDW